MEKKKLLEVARASVEAFNERDWDRFSDLLAPHSVYDEVGTGRKQSGRSEITEVTRAWTRAFPDVKGTIDRETVSDDTVLLEITYRGKHDGELQGPGGSIGPTGKRIEVRCAEVLRIADGLVVENRNYFDMLGMLQSLGAIPAQATRQAGA